MKPKPLFRLRTTLMDLSQLFALGMPELISNGIKLPLCKVASSDVVVNVVKVQTLPLNENRYVSIYVVKKDLTADELICLAELANAISDIPGTMPLEEVYSCVAAVYAGNSNAKDWSSLYEFKVTLLDMLNDGWWIRQVKLMNGVIHMEMSYHGTVFTLDIFEFELRFAMLEAKDNIEKLDKIPLKQMEKLIRLQSLVNTFPSIVLWMDIWKTVQDVQRSGSQYKEVSQNAGGAESSNSHVTDSSTTV